MTPRMARHLPAHPLRPLRWTPRRIKVHVEDLMERVDSLEAETIHLQIRQNQDRSTSNIHGFAIICIEIAVLYLFARLRRAGISV